MSHLLLFDIDATLLLTKGASLRAMKQASAEIFGEGFRWDGIESSGGLDTVLFNQAAKQSGFQVTSEDHVGFRDLYHERLEQELERCAHDVIAMPGALDALEMARGRADIVLGLLTGNYGHAAALKLAAIGVDIGWFQLTVFGDEGASRPELGAVALRKYSALTGKAIAPERVVVIGDTPHDVRCALENGFIAFAVATGKFSTAELAAAGAHHAVESLSNPGRLFGILNGR